MAERLAASGLAAKAQANARYELEDDGAGLGVRLLAYLLDSVVLFAFTMLFASAAFLNIFFRSESGRENPSDAAIWSSVIILMLTVPCWLLFNLVLSFKRGQTVGQYVLGLRVLREEGGSPGLGRLSVDWLGLHPLLFHPLLAGFWLLLAYVSFSLSGNDAVFFASLVAALLCLAGPLANLVFALFDPRRRAIHDRLAGTKVVRLS